MDDGTDAMLPHPASERATPIFESLGATESLVKSTPSSAPQTTKNIFMGTLMVLSSILEGLPIPGAKAIVDTVVKLIGVFEVHVLIVCFPPHPPYNMLSRQRKPMKRPSMHSIFTAVVCVISC